MACQESRNLKQKIYNFRDQYKLDYDKSISLNTLKLK